MIIWEFILKDEDVCTALTRLYAEMGVNPLAVQLGVSRVALLKKLRECGIATRGRGGAHFRIDMSILPDKWWELSTEELCGITNYCANYVRKLRRKKLCDLGVTTKAVSQDLPSDTKELSSELPSTETTPEFGENES
jgi:hypothetical protein